MPVNGFTNVQSATHYSNRCRVTVVCTARMEPTLARQSRKAARKVDVAPDLLILNTARLSKKALTNNCARHEAALIHSRQIKKL